LNERFWERKKLTELTAEEWESLCDGCGRCCLKKLVDETTGELAYTDVACRLLDLDRCRCTAYSKRKQLVPDCIELTPEDAATFAWLPTTCAYRRVAENKPLEWWHPLVSGDEGSVHRAGISVRGRALTERAVDATTLDTRIVHWVKTAPLRRRR
jgi:uncharacterized cysteine cluster protein YcgN (CxxCxxCC family)